MSQGEEPYWEIKRRAIETQQLATEPDYKPIEMPRNSPTGFITAFFCHRHRLRADLAHLVAGGTSGCSAPMRVFVWFAWRDREEYEIPAEEVARVDRARRQVRAQWLARNAREEWLAAHAEASEPA